MVYYIVSGLLLMFFWCPCMAINVNVQYNGGFLPDIILWTQCYLHRGTCLNAMKRFCICSLLIPRKRFDIFPPITGGCSESLGVVWFFFKYIYYCTVVSYLHLSYILILCSKENGALHPPCPFRGHATLVIAPRINVNTVNTTPLSYSRAIPYS